MAKYGITVGRATHDEIKELGQLLQEISWLPEAFENGKIIDSFEEDFPIISRGINPQSTPQELLIYVCRKIASMPTEKLLINLATLLDNCADLSSETLEFAAEIKAGLELLEANNQLTQ
ncbi:hypothetical protein [Sphingobacterium sp.]|uniref:hypothetical protein n=1 Tax=Sphingobacterium sp. TaxID=341027 RepID=UPI0028ADB17A|nr:hypothetical protein [Sphingobacterium sp.]